MTIELERGELFPTVVLAGDFNLDDASKVDGALAVLDLDPTLIVDIGAVRYVDATLLGVLVRLQNARSGRVIVVIDPHHPMARIFDLAKLGDFLHVVADREKANEIAVLLRDISGASFSRDGVKHPGG